MKIIKGVLVLVLMVLISSSAIAVTDKEQIAYDALDNWATSMGEYLAATPTKSGPMPGGTELIGLVKNGPGIVCGISIVMVSKVRQELMREYNAVSDEGDYVAVDKVAKLIIKINTLHSRLEVACTNYFDDHYGMTGDSSGGESAEEEEEEEVDDTNYGDASVAISIVNKIRKNYDLNKKYRESYLTKHGLVGYLLNPPDLNCDSLGVQLEDANSWLEDVKAHRKTLGQSIWAAQNKKIGSTARISVYRLMSELDTDTTETMMLIQYLKSEQRKKCAKVSCDMESLLEKKDQLVIPKMLASSFAQKHVNINCGGVTRITDITTTIGLDGSFDTKVEVDHTAYVSYGVMFNYDGTLSDEIVKGGWEDPYTDITLSSDTFDDLVGADDPRAMMIEQWGKEIFISGNDPVTKLKVGLLNLGKLIVQNKPQPRIAWTPPKLPVFNGRINRGPGVVGKGIPLAPWQMKPGVKPIVPKLPSLKTVATLAFKLPANIIKRAAPPPKKTTCTVRGFTYYCHRGGLTLSPSTVERGKTVTVKASGFTFDGATSLFAEPVASGSYGYTMLKINGRRVNSNTYTFVSDIPVGQWGIVMISGNDRIKDFSEAKTRLTVTNAAVNPNVPGKLGESCDNRKCASGLVCGAPYKTNYNGMRQAPGYGYKCISTTEFNSKCMGRGNTPPAWHCVY